MEQLLPDEEVEEGDQQNHGKDGENEDAVIALRGRIHKHTADAEEVVVCRAAGDVGVQHFGDDDDVPALRPGEERSGDDVGHYGGKKDISHIADPFDVKNMRGRFYFHGNDIQAAHEAEDDIPEHAEENDEDRRAIGKAEMDEKQNDDGKEGEYWNGLRDVEDGQKDALHERAFGDEEGERDAECQSDHISDAKAEEGRKQGSSHGAERNACGYEGKDRRKTEDDE